MWITLTLRYWKPLAAILLMVTLYGYGYLNGMRAVEREMQEAQLRAAQNNLKINAEVSNDYQKKIADLRKRYDAIRLRAASGVRVPHTACGADGKTVTDEFYRGMGESTLTLMYEADQNTQQLLALQGWVRSVSK